jgi:hypothetical protein
LKAIKFNKSSVIIAGLFVNSLVSQSAIAAGMSAGDMTAIAEQLRQGNVTVDYFSSTLEKAQKFGALLSGATACIDNSRNILITLVNASQLSLEMEGDGGYFTSGKVGDAPETVIGPGRTSTFSVCSRSSGKFTGVVGAFGWRAYLDKKYLSTTKFDGIDATLKGAKKESWYTTYKDPSTPFFVGDFSIAFSDPYAGATKFQVESALTAAYYTGPGFTLESHVKTAGNHNQYVYWLMERAVNKLSELSVGNFDQLLAYREVHTNDWRYHSVSIGTTESKNGYRNAVKIILYGHHKNSKAIAKIDVN